VTAATFCPSRFGALRTERGHFNAEVIENQHTAIHVDHRNVGAPPEEHHVNTTRRPIQRWLTTRLGSYLAVPEAAIDPQVPLAEMGVDSVHAISLVGDVEAHFDIDVDATLIFDYPTLSHIAEFIHNAVAARRPVMV
jgi:acyl carrier protein